VLVCIHGSRDCKCGERGGDMFKILKDMVQMTGLTNSVKIYGVSHIGGHKFAPNTIMYPSGDWHGNLSELDSNDAQQILFDALANGGIAGGVRERAADPVMIDKWRGRIGMNKQEQLKLYEQQVNAISIESNKPSTPVDGSSGGAKEPQRVKIIFETFQKVRTEIDAKVGERILDIVKDKDPSRQGVYQALECTCGGQLECATCHVYIEPPFNARLTAVTDAEEDMLEYAVGRKEDVSRLGCQIKIQPELEGMVVKLPQY
ncbi:2Fe-2S ferredoxin-type domain-containing protein, partial [Linnemannia elongata]